MNTWEMQEELRRIAAIARSHIGVNYGQPLDLVGTVTGGKASFRAYDPAPALNEIDPTHIRFTAAEGLTFHELPYTFAEFSREAPLLDARDAACDPWQLVLAGFTARELDLYFMGRALRALNTACLELGLTLEEVAKACLVPSTKPAGVDGGAPRAS